MLTSLAFSLDSREQEFMHIESSTEEFEGSKCNVSMFIGHKDADLWSSLKYDKDFLIGYAAEAQTGVYFSGFNFEHTIKNNTAFGVEDVYKINTKTNAIVLYKDMGSLDIFESYNDYVSTYGVCDNIEQVLKHFEGIINSDLEVVISLTPISRDNQPQSGGWRWHKHGAYIGTQNPQHEYIADEPEIEKVYVFNLHVLK